MLSEEQGHKLIRMARNAIMSEFLNKPPHVPDQLKKEFSEKQGCFVTLTLDSLLRGCIGFPEPAYPLWEAITKAAVAAAFDDPRFLPLSRTEFSKAIIEVSALSVPEEVTCAPEERPSRIEIGKHGLIIRGPSGSGLLLPQVFTEYGATPEQALGMTCQKAGLPQDAWKQPENRLFSFHARVFREQQAKA